MTTTLFSPLKKFCVRTIPFSFKLILASTFYKNFGFTNQKEHSNQRFSDWSVCSIHWHTQFDSRSTQGPLWFVQLSDFYSSVQFISLSDLFQFILVKRNVLINFTHILVTHLQKQLMHILITNKKINKLLSSLPLLSSTTFLFVLHCFQYCSAT